MSVMAIAQVNELSHSADVVYWQTSASPAHVWQYSSYSQTAAAQSHGSPGFGASLGQHSPGLEPSDWHAAFEGAVGVGEGGGSDGEGGDSLTAQAAAWRAAR